MKIELQALIKEVKAKALVSLDKGYEVKLQGEDIVMADLAKAPADQKAKIMVEWND
jgi:hypothetical protein